MNVAVPIVCVVVLVTLGAVALRLSRRWSQERDAILKANRELWLRRQFVEDHVSGPLVMFDGTGLIRRVNSAAEELFGYSESNLVSKSILLLIPESPAEKGGIAEVRCRDGACLKLRFRAARWAANGPPDTYLFFETADHPGEPAASVEPADTAPIEIRPSLAAVEGVVGRIVSQFEGLLTAISGYASLAMRGVAENSAAKADLEQLSEASDTASNLARNLLTFTGKQTIPLAPVDLNALLQSIERQIRFAGHAPLRVNLADVRPVVLANAECLQQIVLLLCKAAQNRSPSRFELTVARRTSDAARSVYTGRIPPGAFCTVAVSDKGPALAESTLAHLFEPLYLDSESVGVELAPVYGIVRTLGGWIDVVSEPEGTTFEIVLPYAGDTQIASKTLELEVGERRDVEF